MRTAALKFVALLTLAGAAPIGAQVVASPDTLVGRNVPFWLQYTASSSDAFTAYRDQVPHPVRIGEVRAASFLTEAGQPAFGVAIGPTAQPTVRAAGYSTVVALGSSFAVLPPTGISYQVGDTLMIVEVEPGPAGWGDIAVPVGEVVVESTGSGHTLTEIINVYGRIRPGQSVLPVPAFSDPGAVAPIPAQGPSGELIAPREVGYLLMPGAELYVSLGRESGVLIGDFVEIRRIPGPRVGAADATADLLGRAQIIHVGSNASTVRLIDMVSPVMPAGSTVTRTATLPH